MSLESLFEVLLPLAILAFFLLQGFFRRPDPIDSFEPPPSPPPQRGSVPQRPSPQSIYRPAPMAGGSSPLPASSGAAYGSGAGFPAGASTGNSDYDEVKARPKRLDTSSYRRSRDKEALGKDAQPKGLGSKPLGQLKAQAAQLNRGEARKSRPLLANQGAHQSSKKLFELMRPEQIRQSARQIYFVKEILDKPLSLRPRD